MLTSFKINNDQQNQLINLKDNEVTQLKGENTQIYTTLAILQKELKQLQILYITREPDNEQNNRDI